MNNYYEEFNGLIQKDLNEKLIDACKDGELDKVKYLLTSPELKIHADIHDKLDSPLNLAVFANKIDVVKYLLTSDELKEHANLHADGDNAFVIAAYYDHSDIVNYLIFELNIEKTDAIKKELADTPTIEKRINKLFEIRDLKQEINIELNPKEIKNIKKPAKI